jgi:hypothetical protein
MKRIVSLLLAVSMILGICATAFAATTYPDLVGDNAKYAAAVDALTELKVVNGFPDGEFKPGNELTRAELAKMLVICLGLGDQVEALAARTVFSDVPSTHWAAGYINAAAQSKVIIGYPDGSFQPEKNVTYAEAFTMVLRALGYGNVVESEGTWPTAYMLKAVELELTDDMEGVTATAPATRGNTAILLWNMLRTPMWRITEESETNGMTLSDRNGRIMLNVKFPNYMYVEDVYLDYVNVTDKDDVRAGISDGNRWDAELGEWVAVNAFEARLKGTDLTKLVPGMKLTALVKDYKDEDKATFLTITPANTLVRGFMTNLKDKDGKQTFEVAGSEYRFDYWVDTDDFTQDSYVSAEVEGKKVKNLIVLPTAVEYAETQSNIDSLDEDALVIIDGEWKQTTDMKTGCVYTEFNGDDTRVDGFYGEPFYVVNSETKTKEFDVAFSQKEEWLSVKDDTTAVDYISLEDKEDRIIVGEFVAKQGEKNNKDVTLDKLEARVKDNDFSGNDAEVFYSYLGLPVRVHFGDVDKNSKNAGFYAVTSNGLWGEGGNKGKIYNVEAVGQDGVEAEYKTITSVDVYDPEGYLETNSKTYREQATFAWFKFDSKNENIEDIVVLENGLTSGDPAENYTSKYDIAELEEETMIDGKDLVGTEYTVNKSAYFYEATAIKNENDKVVGFDVDVTVGRDEYDGYKLPAGTLIAFENGTTKVKYVFIPAESDSNLSWGKLDKINTSKETVKIIGSEATKLNDKSNPDATEGDLVGFSTNKGGDTAKVVVAIHPEDLDDAWMDIIVDGDIDSDDDDDDIIPNALSDGDYDKDDVGTEIKKYKVVKVQLKKDKYGEVTISSVTVSEEKGFDELKAVANDWDRIFIDHANKTIFVFTGVFDKNAAMEDGTVYDITKGSYSDGRA